MTRGRVLLWMALLLAGCAAGPLPSPPAKLAPVSEPAIDELGRKLCAELPRLFAAELSRAEPGAPIVAAYAADHAGDLREAAVLRAVYGRPSAKLRFVDDEKGINATGRRLRSVLGRVDEHALAAPVSHLERLADASIAHQQATVPPVLSFDDLGPARRVLRRALVEPEPLRVAFTMLRSDGSPLPAVAERFADARRARRARLWSLAPVEALLADALLALARQLSCGNTRPAKLAAQWAEPASRPAKQAAPAAVSSAAAATAAASGAAPTPSLEELERSVRLCLRADLEAVKDRRSLEKLLAALPPQYPQYAALQGALRRYRELVNAGGWEKLPAMGRLPTRRHPLLRRLKQRLAAEGWWRGDVDDEPTADLKKAVAEYQLAHQLQPTGNLDRASLASLNVPAEERLQTIALTMQRWRESAIGALPYYVFINVADFHLEVWKQGARLLRQRVVVGKRGPQKCDEETERKVAAFATPLQGARLKTMVFSPYWNVTKAIRETELEPERGKDPEFYERNGYEVMKPDTAGEWVRQLPGPQNPLGFIKFLFPNPHETYLHDTPEKSLFERPLRAFSHGCIRVEDAWRLAQVLLSEDGQWDERRFTRLQKDWKALDVQRLRKDFTPELYESWRKKASDLESTITLRRPVPILVEYYTARVDDAGRVSFLSDIYQLDRQRLQPRAERSCVPESKLAQRHFAAVPTRLAALERRGRELLPQLKRALQAQSKLSGNTSFEVKRLLKRAKKLEEFSSQLGNLAERIREQHESLAEKKGLSKKRQLEGAVRIERLMAGLEKLVQEGVDVSAAILRLVEP